VQQREPALGFALGHDVDQQRSQTLSASLQQLATVNPDCLLVVRRINKLGFKASRILKKHFSSEGKVMRVLVAHSTVRHSDPEREGFRRRPSSLGFVQMETAEAVARILDRGEEQHVDGYVIRVQPFERQSSDACKSDSSIASDATSAGTRGSECESDA
jgi:hypothetical protein